MSLGMFSGKGFLLSDGVELKYANNGTAYARLPLVFKNTRNVDGNWVHDKEFKVDGTVFGALAEFLSQEVQGRQDISVSGELYTEEFTTKNGETKSAVKMNVFSAAPAGKVRERVGSRTAPATSDDVPF